VKRPETLVEYSTLLEYEWRTLAECHDELASGRHAEGTLIYRGLVEASLIHRRALIDFFFKDRLWPTDISLRDWFPVKSDEFCAVRASVSRGDLDAEADKVGKIVAHITTLRLPKWEIAFDSSLIAQVDALMFSFLDHAKPDTVHVSLLRLRDQLRCRPQFADIEVQYSTAGGAFDKPAILSFGPVPSHLGNPNLSPLDSPVNPTPAGAGGR
jgi:hypothetical protein